jgi:hypothetical protein
VYYPHDDPAIGPYAAPTEVTFIQEIADQRRGCFVLESLAGHPGATSYKSYTAPLHHCTTNLQRRQGSITNRDETTYTVEDGTYFGSTPELDYKENLVVPIYF